MRLDAGRFHKSPYGRLILLGHPFRNEMVHQRLIILDPRGEILRIFRQLDDLIRFILQIAEQNAAVIGAQALDDCMMLLLQAHGVGDILMIASDADALGIIPVAHPAAADEDPAPEGMLPGIFHLCPIVRNDLDHRVLHKGPIRLLDAAVPMAVAHFR